MSAVNKDARLVFSVRKCRPFQAGFGHRSAFFRALKGSFTFSRATFS